eukprot:g3133.t1
MRFATLQPFVTGLQPFVTGPQPSVTGLQPFVTGLQPALSAVQPFVTGLQPFVTGLQPAAFCSGEVKVGGGPCINGDYVPRHKHAVFILLAAGNNYFHGALKVGASAMEHSSVAFDLVALELRELPAYPERRALAQRLGWQICVVERIKPYNVEQAAEKFRDVYSKLHVFRMVQYSSILFLDADTVVVGDITPLITLELKAGKRIAATRDFNFGRWLPTFNTGVFAIRPDANEFVRLMRLKEQPALGFDDTFAEQSFLNFVYKDAWHELGFIDAASTMLYGNTKTRKTVWLPQESSIRVIHFTMEKPWHARLSELYGVWAEGTKVMAHEEVQVAGAALRMVDDALAKLRMQPSP